MVNAEKQRNKLIYDKVKEGNKQLSKLKDKWEVENKVSGSFKVPDNILDLEGVEYLLKLNIFNEVPTVLSFVAPYLVEYSLLCNSSKYSEETRAVYVEKGSKLIENLLGLYKELGVDLANSEENLIVASRMYIIVLSSKIGKSEEYKL